MRNHISSEPTKHPSFWLDDGSMVIVVEDHAFKVHKTLLSRHSNFFSNKSPVLESIELDYSPNAIVKTVVKIDPSKGIRALDVEALLKHLYHDTPLYFETKLPQIAAIFHVSSPLRLDFPSIHALAKQKLESIASPFTIPLFQPDNPEEVLSLAKDYEIYPIQKALYYHFVASPGSIFDAKSTESTNDLAPVPGYPETTKNAEDTVTVQQGLLSRADERRCERLMERIIDHFTPILFTPPATPHMACTDVFAETWMPFVIQPAIENDGVYKPFETLKRIKAIDWAKAGLCQACVSEKHDEWTQEQQDIWNNMDRWLDLTIS